MAKVIKLIMNDDKSISIQIDGILGHTITMDDRSINADTIFSFFDFKMGDTYQIQKENPNNNDNKALDFFYDLINEIATKVNNIKLEEE